MKLLQRYLPADWDPQLSALCRLNGKSPERVDYVAGLWYCKLSLQAPPVMFSQQLLWSTSYYKAHFQSTDRELAINRTFLASTIEAGLSSTVTTPATRISRFEGSWRNNTSLAPTWSWASVDGPIAYSYMIGDLPQSREFTVMSCETQVELSEASYGNVRHIRTIENTVFSDPLLLRHSFFSPRAP
jgi:hypothetical protein